MSLVAFAYPADHGDTSVHLHALLERPDLTESDLSYLPRNVITRALGMGPTVDVDMKSEPARVGTSHCVGNEAARRRRMFRMATLATLNPQPPAPSVTVMQAGVESLRRER